MSDYFYTTTGFSFKAKANHEYALTLKEAGSEEKMLMLRVSDKKQLPQGTAKSHGMS